MISTRVNFFLAMISLSLITGCGGKADPWEGKRHKVYPATGTVEHDGKPLADANVIFYSESENISGYGKTDAQGNFRLSTYGDGDGVVAGDQIVTITKVEAVLPESRKGQSSEDLAIDEVKSLIPGRYGRRETSGLSATVDSSKDENHFQFQLTK